MTWHPRPTPTLAAVFIVGVLGMGCGNSGSAKHAAASDGFAGVTIDMPSGSSYGASMSYRPNPAVVKVGQPVRWLNQDSVDHTASQTPSGFDTGVVKPGATSAPITMTEPGTFAYTCVVSGHRMSGTLVVTQ